ncbi:hypothetical protein B296_00016940, partial [Ensete ventricosum]
LAGLDGGRVDVEQVGIAGKEGLDMDGEAEALAAILEVAEGDGLAGLVENLADHTGAEPPPLVPVDGGVQQRVLAPRDLEARDRGCPTEETRRRAKKAAAEEEVRLLETRRERGHSVLLVWRRQPSRLPSPRNLLTPLHSPLSEVDEVEAERGRGGDVLGDNGRGEHEKERRRCAKWQ